MMRSHLWQSEIDTYLDIEFELRGAAKTVKVSNSPLFPIYDGQSPVVVSMDGDQPYVLVPELGRVATQPPNFLVWVFASFKGRNYPGREYSGIATGAGSTNVSEDHLRSDIDAIVVQPPIPPMKPFESLAIDGQGTFTADIGWDNARVESIWRHIGWGGGERYRAVIVYLVLQARTISLRRMLASGETYWVGVRQPELALKL